MFSPMIDEFLKKTEKESKKPAKLVMTFEQTSDDNYLQTHTLLNADLELEQRYLKKVGISLNCS